MSETSRECGMVWASRNAIWEKIADVPENWLRAFAVRHPNDFRKFATTRNGSALYRVSAVLQAIEDGEGMPNAGIKETPFEIGVKDKDAEAAEK